MQLHLDEISRTVARGAQAVLLLDRAGWHTTGQLVVPKNLKRREREILEALAEERDEDVREELFRRVGS